MFSSSRSSGAAAGANAPPPPPRPTLVTPSALGVPRAPPRAASSPLTADPLLRLQPPTNREAVRL
jgi:hypothetical protein